MGDGAVGLEGSDVEEEEDAVVLVVLSVTTPDVVVHVVEVVGLGKGEALCVVELHEVSDVEAVVAPWVCGVLSDVHVEFVPSAEVGNLVDEEAGWVVAFMGMSGFDVVVVP